MKRDPIDEAIEFHLDMRWEGNSDYGYHRDQPYKTDPWYLRALVRRSRRGQYFRRLRRLQSRH